ncbi:hypothetical protein [Legionella fallonii]|nr:hypothetical protein [Legionella fallonii]
MKNTDFQLMPIVAMLNNFKVAPMVGELTQGGFAIIGNGSNDDTIIGATSFGRMKHEHYDLDKIIESYTKLPHNVALNSNKENFNETLKAAHKAAFSQLNLLMIYLVRLRQLGVQVSDIMSLDDINILKESLDATVQFYYFILCIQKHIFIDAAAMELFKEENNLEGGYAVGDYIIHFFSFGRFIEKLRKSQLNIEEIYNSPSSENINKLLEFIKIPNGTQEKVERYSLGEANFIAKRDYHFFTAHKPELNCELFNEKIGGYLFCNRSGYSLTNYLEKYYEAYNLVQKHNKTSVSVPDFEKFHTEVLPYIEALKDRIQLCNTLIDADDKAFVPYEADDELITNPFPVVFVTEAKTLEVHEEEYRSRAPLKLGKEIVLVATDTVENQKRLRDYIQDNNVGPVEVCLFADLYALRSQPSNYFDAFASDDLLKAFEIAKEQNCEVQFSKLYRALSELNEKRYRFKGTNDVVYEELDKFFTDLQQNILTADKNKINFKGIQEICQRNKQENYALYATHRGILGAIDTILTILASLVVFYPITYLVRKSMGATHTFFATDTEKRVNNTLVVMDEVMNEMTIAESRLS